MHIESFLNNGTRYLRLVASKRVLGKDGKKKYSKEVIHNIGPYSRHDDGLPNYLERLRASFRQGVPMIESIVPYALQQQGSEPEKITLEFSQGSGYCIGHPKFFSHVLLDRIFTELGLAQFFTLLKSRNNIDYDLLGLVKLLVFGRILNPQSKFSTFEQKDDYFDVLTSCENPYAIYNVLDILHNKRINIIQKMNAAISSRLGRNPEIIFYDVTNFFFEIENADSEYETDGQVHKGLRQRGVSKENRRTPIVQMGLFMDDKGLPISFEFFPGNTLDQATLRPALKATVDQFGYGRFILVSDRGMSSYKNILHLRGQGHGYIISKSLKKSAAAERQWTLNNEGYVILNESFRHKSRIVRRKEKDETGQKKEFDEKIVVYWSEKFYKREYHEHQDFLNFVKKLQQFPENFRVSKTQLGKLRKFFKKDVVNKDTGEILESKKLLLLLDEEKLEEFTAYMGYYQIATSELEMDDLAVIEKYHGLSRIEDQFRVLKSDLDARPIYVRTREHIDAHFTVCLIALTIVRLIQYKIRMFQGKNLSACRDWSSGLTTERIQNALCKWKVDELPGFYYRFNDITDTNLILILKAFGVELDPKLFSSKQLRAIKTKMAVLI